jgi:superfamily II DNA or RNA helicase
LRKSSRKSNQLTDSQLRNRTFELDGDGPPPGHAYAHQIEALRRIEMGAGRIPPVSGILHFPTGSGKTRVALELIVRTLRSDMQHRFLWATASKQLIRQSMMRMAELSKLFPPGTRFAWAKNGQVLVDDELDVHVLFLTRHSLTEAMNQAADGRRRSHPWRLHLEQRRPLTLIYDECHQLGAELLQQSWRKFQDSVVAPPRAWKRPWRTIGLSATPVPTNTEAHRLLEEHIFPIRNEGMFTRSGWPFHVFHRVRNEALLESGVLCPINQYIDKSGEFDIPTHVLQQAIGESHLAPPGEEAGKVKLQQYAMQFNSGVLAHPSVLEHLAACLGRNITLLGKTIVFVPNIAAANRLAALLYEGFPALRGKVAAVHNKMEELQVPGQDKSPVHEVLGRFRGLGDEPSILINVEMLTEGFDDPKIHTVLLARLTLSTNRFWQMIGRGTRGPAANGTNDCIVIDPVKLVRLYDYFGGYQPNFSSKENREFEDVDDEAGNDLIPPQIPSMDLPPDPHMTRYKLDPEFERIHQQVAIALRHFLTGQPISESQAVEVARNATVRLTEGCVSMQPTTDGAFQSTTAVALLLGEICSLEASANVDLGWFRRQMPPEVNEILLRQQMRKLRAIQTLQLWTHEKYALAEMSGDFLRVMQLEAQGTDSTTPATDMGPGPSATPKLDLTPAEEAVVDAALVVAASDGSISREELVVVAETLRRLFGRAVNDELVTKLAARVTPMTFNSDCVRSSLSPPQCQLLLLQLAEIAAVDGAITAGERDALASFAAGLGIPIAVVGAVLGGQPTTETNADDQGGLRNCSSCSALLTPGAKFCSACGQKVPDAIRSQECPSCSCVLPAEAAYCGGCGTRL